MNATPVKLLHIEDDPLQRRLVAHYLQSCDNWQFDITAATDEETALAEFERGKADCVLLDYHLSRGDGVSCLRQIRSRDARVPVIAISGVATPEIAARLLREGADDYLDKQGLRPEMLMRSIGTALARHRAWQRSERRRPARLRMLLKRFRQHVRDLDRDLFELAESVAQAVPHAELTEEETTRLMKEVCGDGSALDIRDRLLRGMVRELLRHGGPVPFSRREHDDDV